MCKVRTVTTRGNKNEKDPHPVELLLDREEQPQVMGFDPETVFGLSINNRARIPSIDCLFSKDLLTMTLQDI